MYNNNLKLSHNYDLANFMITRVQVKFKRTFNYPNLSIIQTNQFSHMFRITEFLL